jgi:hypothetical protein
VIDRVSHKYTGKPFPFRGKPAERVVLVIAVRASALSYTALRSRPGIASAGAQTIPGTRERDLWVFRRYLDSASS